MLYLIYINEAIMICLPLQKIYMKGLMADIYIY